MRATALALLLASSQALACGVCVEDKIAAVYDHAAVQKSLAAKRTVVFFHIDGKLVVNERSKRAIADIARGPTSPGPPRAWTPRACASRASSPRSRSPSTLAARAS
jgi:hypothetical protein